VGPLLVVLAAPGGEAPLLRRAVGGRGQRGGCLEGAMEALMAAILLGVCRLDQLGVDAEVHPPDGQLRQAGRGTGRKGDPVIGADDVRQAELAEQPLEDGPSGRLGDVEQGLAAEQLAAVGVEHSQGIAVHPI
jgi:hypothetical protein